MTNDQPNQKTEILFDEQAEIPQWDAEGGTPADDIALTIIAAEGGFITTVEVNETIYLVTGDDWLSTAEARAAIKRILSPPKSG